MSDTKNTWKTKAIKYQIGVNINLNQVVFLPVLISIIIILV